MLDNPFVRSAGTLLRRNVWFVTLFQAVIIFVAFVLAWLLRFDFSLPHRRLLLAAFPALICIRLIALARFGLFHGWWRYVGAKDVVDIVKADVLGSVAFFIVVRYVLHLQGFPRSIYVSEALLTTGMLAGVRLLSRLLAESLRQNMTAKKKAIIIGAGFAARMVLREMEQPGSDYRAIACLDDDPTKRGLKIHGISVLGSVESLPEIFDGGRDECEVIIAIPSATSLQMKRIVELCDKARLQYRTVPSLKELISGSQLVQQLRPVDLDDLLGREPVALDVQAVSEKIGAKVVMVTGAAGSIGSEICRQLLECSPYRLVCVDHNENGMFHLQRELDQLDVACEIVFCVANIRDHERLLQICSENLVTVIFHAAAYKHVPMMEANPSEAVRNNVFGLLTLLDVAETVACSDLVLISSDKAVNPTSVMGATKRICELMVASRPPNGLRCVSVRFGNVLGSNGSVVPIFQDQLDRGLPITITHPEIERFFMTITEAVSLVLRAFAVGNHGDILVLDMGKSIKIVELARSLIRLAGKSEQEVRIEFTGLRPGEKLAEDVFYPDEQVLTTAHKKIHRVAGSSSDWPELLRQLSELEGVVAQGIANDVLSKVGEIVPEYCYIDRSRESAPPMRVFAAAGSDGFHHREPEIQSMHSRLIG
jgi:FlaA1/EpsC-like NDP-sugar epimerase